MTHDVEHVLEVKKKGETKKTVSQNGACPGCCVLVSHGKGTPSTLIGGDILENVSGTVDLPSLSELWTKYASRPISISLPL